MSLLVVFDHQTLQKEAVRYAYFFARALEQELVILTLEPGKEQKKLEENETYDFRSYNSDDPVLGPLSKHLQESEQLWESSNIQQQLAQPDISLLRSTAKKKSSKILQVSKELSPRLLILFYHLEHDEQQKKMAERIMERALCDVLLLRPASESCSFPPRILVPAAGGPHALHALKLADVFSKNTGAKTTPLFIESDHDEVALEVGQKILAKTLRKASMHDNEHVTPQVVVSNDVKEGIHSVTTQGYDLMLLGASGTGNVQKYLFGSLSASLLRQETGLTVGILRAGKTLRERIAERFERLLLVTVPQLNREDRISVFESLESGSRWSFDFMALLILSTAIASLGLLQSSTAVVIGAMLVAPLMVPLLGAGLAIAQGNFPLVKRAAKAVFMGFLLSFVVGAVIGTLSSVSALTPELLARTQPTLMDLAIAYLSGLAAAYCVARPNLSAALAGVAIAAALVPPIATMGIATSLGNLNAAQGAALLFGTNVIAIILGAATSLYAGGIRGKKSEHGGVLWVRRIFLGLLLGALALSLPLGSVFVAQVASTHSLPQKQIESMTRMVDSFAKKRKWKILSREFSQIHKGTVSIRLSFESSRTPSRFASQDLAKECKKTIKAGCSVELRPSLVLAAKAMEDPALDL